jgi:hypothetical protein
VNVFFHLNGLLIFYFTDFPQIFNYFYQSCDRDG